MLEFRANINTIYKDGDGNDVTVDYKLFSREVEEEDKQYNCIGFDYIIIDSDDSIKTGQVYLNENIDKKDIHLEILKQVL